MQRHFTTEQTGISTVKTPYAAVPRLALDEHELSQRWGLSVKTLRRWRQEKLGPIFCKMGARVTYLISEIEAYERRVSRHSTFTSVYQ